LYIYFFRMHSGMLLHIDRAILQSYGETLIHYVGVDLHRIQPIVITMQWSISLNFLGYQTTGLRNEQVYKPSICNVTLLIHFLDMNRFRPRLNLKISSKFTNT
jgi:hypothetical protein